MCVSPKRVTLTVTILRSTLVTHPPPPPRAQRLAITALCWTGTRWAPHPHLCLPLSGTKRPETRGEAHPPAQGAPQSAHHRRTTPRQQHLHQPRPRAPRPCASHRSGPAWQGPPAAPPRRPQPEPASAAAAEQARTHAQEKIALGMPLRRDGATGLSEPARTIPPARAACRSLRAARSSCSVERKARVGARVGHGCLTSEPMKLIGAALNWKLRAAPPAQSLGLSVMRASYSSSQRKLPFRTRETATCNGRARGRGEESSASQGGAPDAGPGATARQPHGARLAGRRAAHTHGERLCPRKAWSPVVFGTAAGTQAAGAGPWAGAEGDASCSRWRPGPPRRPPAAPGRTRR